MSFPGGWSIAARRRFAAPLRPPPCSGSRARARSPRVLPPRRPARAATPSVTTVLQYQPPRRTARAPPRARGGAAAPQLAPRRAGVCPWRATARCRAGAQAKLHPHHKLRTMRKPGGWRPPRGSVSGCGCDNAGGSDAFCAMLTRRRPAAPPPALQATPVAWCRRLTTKGPTVRVATNRRRS